MELSGLLPGQKIGKLTLIEELPKKNGRRYWQCVCDCGNECVVQANHLKSGHTKSCGCYRREISRKKKLDLTGQRFGRLLVLGCLSEKKEKGTLWECRCDCGNICICQTDGLRRGATRSCGCFREEKRRENMKTAIHFVDGTCVERIASGKLSSANTSGHRGVYRRKNGGWRATIGFKGKVYNLGSFQRIEDAVSARKEAEKKLYMPFLEEYKKNEKNSSRTTE
ncbi:MAG: hypothetical protein LUC99_10585 [Clostridiales bacterium]|nr:hypothetical protein [Clostridiales bacterium]